MNDNNRNIIERIANNQPVLPLEMIISAEEILLRYSADVP
jgi:hypothetical protein